MKCCDTCRHFLYNGDKTGDVEYVNAEGKKVTGPVAIGTCGVPVPPWARVFVSIAGAEVARVQANDGKDCQVYHT